MHATIRSSWLGVGLLFGIGYGQALAEPSATRPAESERIDATQATSDDAERTVRARRQSRYNTTLVIGSDGERYTDGDARLTIEDRATGPRITLLLQAWNDQGKAWAAQIALPESAILSRRAEIALGGHPAELQIRTASGQAGRERLRPARLELARIADPGTRPVLEGSVHADPDAMSAEFRTEYSVECLVAPEALGQTANGGPAPGSRVIGVFVPDERFESAFCQKFVSVR